MATPRPFRMHGISGFVRYPAHESQADEGRQEEGSAVADERKWKARDRHQSHRHSDVYDEMREPDRKEAKGDEASEAMT